MGRLQGRLFVALCTTTVVMGTGCRDHAPRADGKADAASHDASISLVDDNGHALRLAGPARRVVSLIPSANETLIALGATAAIVGRTRYDVAPEIVGVPSVGGGIDANIESIVALKPDVVIVWENDKRQVVRTKLMALNVPTFSLRTQDTADVFRSIYNLGRLVGRDSAARLLIDSIHSQLDDVKASVKDLPRTSAFFVVYNDPPMTASPLTFIGQLLSLAGGTPIFTDTLPLWRQVPMEEIVRRNPDVVIVPVGEFKGLTAELMRKRAGWRTVSAVQQGHVVTVNANLLSRPGARIGEAARVLRAALHPQFAKDTATSKRTSTPAARP